MGCPTLGVWFFLNSLMHCLAMTDKCLKFHLDTFLNFSDLKLYGAPYTGYCSTLLEEYLFAN
jgi:hypothetical protein